MIKYLVRCTECQAEFKFCEGGLILYEVLHCDRCAARLTIPIADVSQLYSRNVAGVAWDDKETQGIESSPEEQYHAEVEKGCDPCICGGAFRFDASMRCPNCRSTECEKVDIICFYD